VADLKYYPYIAWGTNGNHENPVMIVGVSSEIRRGHLPDKSPWLKYESPFLVQGREGCVSRSKQHNPFAFFFTDRTE
jgi:hypothetical protein